MKPAFVIAAASVFAAGIFTGAVLTKIMEETKFEEEYEAVVTTVCTTTAETTETVTTASTVVTSTTAAASSTAAAVTTAAVDLSVIPDVITEDYLRQKCAAAPFNCGRFSADFTVQYFSGFDGRDLTWTNNGKVIMDSQASKGQVFTDYADVKSPFSHYQFMMKDRFVQTYAYTWRDILSFANGDYGEVPMTAYMYPEIYYSVSDTSSETAEERSFPTDFPGFWYLKNYRPIPDSGGLVLIKNESDWTIENIKGTERRSVHVYYTADMLTDGKYEQHFISFDADLETGILTSLSISNGYVPTEQYKLTDIKYGDDAETPMSAEQIREFIESEHLIPMRGKDENGDFPPIIDDLSDEAHAATTTTEG